MATRFAVIVAGEDPDYARQAARAAFREVARIEADLSHYVESSDIARLNSRPAGEPLPVGPAAWDCLCAARWFWEETGGAFDVASGPLVDLWKRRPPGAPAPSDDEIASARAGCGMGQVLLDPSARTAALARAGMAVDLGAVGKGYAVDRVAVLLRDEWEIANALVEGGQSSVFAWGCLPGQRGWPVSLRDPADQAREIATVELDGVALGGSAAVLQGTHIVDPRSGRPAGNATAAWALCPTAMEADILSTALMVMGAGEAGSFFTRHAAFGGLVVSGGTLHALGGWPRSDAG